MNVAAASGQVPHRPNGGQGRLTGANSTSDNLAVPRHRTDAGVGSFTITPIGRAASWVRHQLEWAWTAYPIASDVQSREQRGLLPCT